MRDMDINSVRRLFSEFEKKSKELTGVDSLSEALDIASDIMKADDDTNAEIARIARNIVSTGKKFAKEQAEKVIQLGYNQDLFEFWQGVFEEFIGYGLDENDELSILVEEFSNSLRKDRDRRESLTKTQREKQLLDFIRRLTPEEYEKLCKLPEIRMDSEMNESG